jgi:ribosomal protein S2
MKIKKVKIQQLLKLHLLKSKVYEQSIKKMKFTDLIDSNLSQIIVDLKKVLQVIFQYHQINKRILFLGFPSKFEVKVNQLTQHVAVPSNFDIQGVISNYNRKSVKLDRNSNQVWLKTYSKFLLPKLSKQSDLIVLLDCDKEKTLLSEAKRAKIPVIALGPSFESSDKILYSVKGNFQNTVSDRNIFFICLNFLFKKRRPSYYKEDPRSKRDIFI